MLVKCFLYQDVFFFCTIGFLNQYILLEEIGNEKRLTIHWPLILKVNLVYALETVKFCLFLKSVP